MTTTHTCIHDTPVGDVTIVAQDDAIVAVHLGPPPATTAPGRRDEVIERRDDAVLERRHDAVGQRRHDDVLEAAREQLTAYFAGEAVTFDLPLSPEGSAFQARVWEELRRIPYGETRSYLDVAVALGDRDLVRAVGAANGANPIAIVVPCHRVVGSDGRLVGYAGGLQRKRTLLDLEAGVGRLFA